MQLAIVAAGFTAGEADQLRRAMAAWRRNGELEKIRATARSAACVERGYREEFAQRLFSQIKGFGEYGFPESHAASFALLVYVSAWLKRYEPAAFCCALLNSQPMGFYAPQQLVRSARDHGVEVRSVDINHSDWDCTLERGTAGDAAVRLGMRLVKGLASDAAAACSRGAHGGSIRHCPGFGRASAAQRQGSGRAGFGRIARHPCEPSSPCALGRGRCGAAHGPARARAFRRGFTDSAPADRRRGHRGRLPLRRREPRQAPADVVAAEARGGRNQDGSCRRGVGAGRARPLRRARHHSATAFECVGGYLRNPRGRDGLLESRGLGAAGAASQAGIARCNVARRIWGRAEGERRITRDCRAAFRSQ